MSRNRAARAADTGTPRFITPDMPVEKQIEVFKALVASDTARPLLFTPELARHILANENNYNRGLNAATVERYALDMAGGNWRRTGESLKFTRSGSLLDGQHRLAASIEAGAAFVSYLVGNIDPDVFHRIDGHRPRNASNIFGIDSVPYPSIAGPAVRWMHIVEDFSNRAVTFSPAALFETYQQYTEDQRAAFSWAVSQADGITRSPTAKGAFVPSMLAAVLCNARMAHPKAAEQFASDLKTGASVGGKVIAVVRSTLRVIPWSQRVEASMLGTLINAWNCYAPGGKKVVKTDDLLHQGGKGNPLPAMAR